MNQAMTARKLAKKYRLLIWFPSMKIVLLLYLATMISVAMAILYLSDVLRLDLYVFFLTNFLLPLVFLASNPIINVRRSLGPIPAFNIMLLLSIIASIYLLQESTTVYFFSVIIGLSYITCRIFDKRGFGIFLLLIALLLPALLSRSLFPITIIGFSSLIVSESLLQYTTYLEEKVLGKRYSILNAFLDYILVNNSKRLEAILSDISGKIEKLSIYTLSFISTDRKKIIGALVIPFIHPGPFRDLGSSALPSILMEKFRNTGIPALVLHGVSSHERDLILKSDTIKIVEHLTTAISRNEGRPVKISKFFRENSKNFTSFSLKINNYFLTFISGKSKGFEDIPFDIMVDLSKKLPVKPVVVDSHNRLDPKGENPRPLPSTPYYNEILDLIINACQKAPPPIYSIVKVGFYSTNIDEYSIESGIGKGGAAGMVLELNKEKYFLLTLDGNNLINPYRDVVLQKIISELDFKDGEITTTDTHAVAGIMPKREYSPLGDKISIEKLINYSIKTIRKAQENMETCHVKINEYEFKLPILGSETISKISTLASKSTIALLISMFLTLIIGLLLSFILV